MRILHTSDWHLGRDFGPVALLPDQAAFLDWLVDECQRQKVELVAIAGDLYDRAVNIVLRDRKCSTSYIQRRLSVGYNKAASLVERMEQEGVVSAPSHSGKREVLVGGGIDRGAYDIEAAE